MGAKLGIAAGKNKREFDFLFEKAEWVSLFSG